mgnify:CR=1 FL=1
MSSVFVSYSHKDLEVFDRVLTHLTPLKRITDIKVFSDQDIKTDEEWRDKIRLEIDKADIGILLVSADFLASDFIVEQELPALFKKRQESNKRLLTLFVSPANYKLYPEIEKYQAFNDPNLPISSLNTTNREKLLAKLSEEIQNSLPEIGGDGEELKLNSSQLPAVDDPKSWDHLEELDYLSITGRKTFFNQKVSIPLLCNSVGKDLLEGYSFESCWLRGPCILFAPVMYADGVMLDVAEGRNDSILYIPKSDWMVGVIGMSHLKLSNCRISNIGFIDKDDMFTKAFGEKA